VRCCGCDQLCSELTTPDLKADERKAVALDIVLSYKGSLNIKLSDMGGTKVLIFLP